MARERSRESAGGPRVTGVELAAGAARAVVARADSGRVRVLGRGDAAIPPGAVVGGLVVDRAAASRALVAAIAAAERGGQSERAVVAIDGDDVRTFHVATPLEREISAAPITRPEIDRALREARDDAGRQAQGRVEDDPALRGVATARIAEEVSSLVLDGRALESLAGYHGRSLEVHTDVTVAPLVLSGAAIAAMASTRRRVSVMSGIYALARLVAESGIADAGVVRIGSDVTAMALVRERRVVASRVFGLGRDALAGRDATRDEDARVWAECVAAPLAGHDGPPPERWLFVGVPETMLALPSALREIVQGGRGSAPRIGPLSVGITGRVFADIPLGAEDLIAAGTAALAAGVYE